jgi:hypothetical protein
MRKDYLSTNAKLYTIVGYLLLPRRGMVIVVYVDWVQISGNDSLVIISRIDPLAVAWSSYFYHYRVISSLYRLIPLSVLGL